MCCPQDQTSILNQDQGNHLNLRKKEIHVHYLHIKWPKAKSVKLNCFLMLSVCFCQKLYLYGSIPLFHCSTYISIFLIFKCGRFSEDHLTGWITWSGGVTTPTVTPTISPQTPSSFKTQVLLWHPGSHTELEAQMLVLAMQSNNVRDEKELKKYILSSLPASPSLYS